MQVLIKRVIAKSIQLTIRALKLLGIRAADLDRGD